MVRYSFLVRSLIRYSMPVYPGAFLDHPIRSAPSFIRRPSQPKQHWDFHQTERRLTSHRSGDIAQARKKGGLKFLYRSTCPSFAIPDRIS